MATTFLEVDAAAGATSITLGDGTAFTADPQYIIYVLDSPVQVTAKSGDVLTVEALAEDHTAGEPIMDVADYTAARILAAKLLRLKAAGTGTPVVEAGVDGDAFTFPRWSTEADGLMHWGSGTTDPEIHLSRTASFELTLETGGRFIVDARFNHQGAFPDITQWTTSPQNNVSLSPADRSVYRVSSSIAVNLTGITNGQGGDRIVLLNTGGNTISLLHQSASSTDVNRFVCPSSATYSLVSNGSAEMIYDATSNRWRILS